MSKMDKFFKKGYYGGNSESIGYLKYAEKFFKEGNYQETLRLLILGFHADPSFIGLYELAYKTFTQLGSTDEANLFKRVIEDFDDFDTFFNLGYHYVDIAHFSVAIPFLQRAFEISPEDLHVAMELSIALTAEFQPGKGRAVLEFVEKGNDFWAWYQYYWCSLLSGETKGLDSFIRSMKEFFTMDDERRNRDAASCLMAIERLEECLIRYKMLRWPEADIMHWQYIQYGSVLLDMYNKSEEDMLIAGGRYIAKWPRNHEIKELLLRLHLMIRSLDLSPGTILYLPDRDSEIIGKLASRVMRLPCMVYMKDFKGSHVVICASDEILNDYPELSERRNGQILFSMNLNWMKESQITADIIGFMSQSYRFPWNGEITMSPKSGIKSSMPPDDRKPDAIVADLAPLEAEVDLSFKNMLDFYTARKNSLKCKERRYIRRLPFTKDSPVRGSFSY